MTLIRIACLYRPGKARTGVTSYAERMKKALGNSVELEFFREIPETGFDLIHIIDVKCATINDLMNKKVPVIADLHDYYWAEYQFFFSLDFPFRWVLQKWRKPKFQKILEMADAVIVHSNAVARYVKNPNVFLVPIGVEYERLYAEPEKFREPLILLVGRDQWRKGLGTLISALRILKRDFPDLNWRAEVIGNEYPPSRIFAKIFSLGLNMKFIPEMSFDELVSRYKQAMIIFLGSYQEGFGLSLIEGMSAGCIAIGSDTGGIPEIIKDRKTGIMFKAGDKIDLAIKIARVLEYEDMRLSLSKNGQEYVRDSFTLEKMGESLVQVYQGVLKRAR